MKPRSTAPTGSEIRVALASWLAHQGRLHRAIYEFWIPRSNARADLAVVGPLIEGYEIKARGDRLCRLPAQAAAYGTVFDRCSAVVDERHIAGATAALEPWWGLIVVDRFGDISVLRDASENPGVRSEILIELLWTEDARAVLHRLGSRSSDQASRHQMWQEIVQTTSPLEVRRLVRDVLGTRSEKSKRFGRNRQAAAESQNVVLAS